MNSPEKRSFFHYAARYSLYAPLGAILLNILVTEGVRHQSNAATYAIIQRVISYFLATLYLTGFISGFIALFGIPKYGRKGILGFAISGIAIGILVIGTAIFLLTSIGRTA